MEMDQLSIGTLDMDHLQTDLVNSLGIDQISNEMVNSLNQDQEVHNSTELEIDQVTNQFFNSLDSNSIPNNTHKSQNSNTIFMNNQSNDNLKVNTETEILNDDNSFSSSSFIEPKLCSSNDLKSNNLSSCPNDGNVSQAFSCSETLNSDIFINQKTEESKQSICDDKQMKSSENENSSSGPLLNGSEMSDSKDDLNHTSPDTNEVNRFIKIKSNDDLLNGDELCSNNSLSEYQTNEPVEKTSDVELNERTRLSDNILENSNSVSNTFEDNLPTIVGAQSVAEEDVDGIECSEEEVDLPCRIESTNKIDRLSPVVDESVNHNLIENTNELASKDDQASSYLVSFILLYFDD